MNHYLAILFLSMVAVLSGCGVQDNSLPMNEEIVEEQTSDFMEEEPTITVFGIDDYRTSVVTAELKEGEILDDKDFMTSISSMEEFLTYHDWIPTEVSSTQVNITDETFKNHNVWYIRMYMDEEKFPMFQLSRLETFENSSGILYLDELGIMEWEPNGENIYSYSEYIFLTDSDIVELQVEYEDSVSIEHRKLIELK